MKLIIIVFAFTIVLFLQHTSNGHGVFYRLTPLFQRPILNEYNIQFPVPTQCVCRPIIPDSPAKGLSVKGKRTRQPNVPNTPSQAEAACNENADEEIAASFNTLTLFGDRDIKLSFHDGHHEDHCTAAQKHLKKFNDHMQCLKGEHGKVLRLIGDGFIRTVKKRCTSKEWHKQFIELSHCLNDPVIIKDYHACHDKIYASEAYILRNIPAKDQASVICCFVEPQLSGCLNKHVTKYCGRKAAEFIGSTIWEPFVDYFNHTCGGKYAEHCIDKYPEAIKEFDKIFASKVPARHLGTYKLLFRIMENHYNVEHLL